jgi:hypothetical protein
VFLKDLIEWLEKQDPKAHVPHGFGSPDSFRGIYDDLAFEPKEDACIGDMLNHARNALGSTYEGFHGGEFFMHEYTTCWISEYGTSHNATCIGSTVLNLWEELMYVPTM